MPRPLLLGALVVTALCAGLWGLARGDLAPVGDDVPIVAAGDVVSRATTDAPSRAARSRGDALATVAGLDLVMPVAEPLAVGFLEGLRPDALALSPVGRMVEDASGATWEPPADQPGVDYTVLPLRAGTRSPTSGVNVLAAMGTAALAPVDGEVVSVKRYRLHGDHHDWRVVIRPEGRRDLDVVVFHLHEPGVAVGDTVEARRTELGLIRLLPVPSQPDVLADGERMPHVHLEVRPAAGDRRPDPNAPAVAPDSYLILEPDDQ